MRAIYFILSAVIAIGSGIANAGAGPCFSHFEKGKLIVICDSSVVNRTIQATPLCLPGKKPPKCG